MGHERLTAERFDKILATLSVGDPDGEVAAAWLANYPALGGGSRRSVGRLAAFDVLEMALEAGDHPVVTGGFAGPASLVGVVA